MDYSHEEIKEIIDAAMKKNWRECKDIEFTDVEELGIRVGTHSWGCYVNRLEDTSWNVSASKSIYSYHGEMGNVHIAIFSPRDLAVVNACLDLNGLRYRVNYVEK